MVLMQKSYMTKKGNSFIDKGIFVILAKFVEWLVKINILSLSFMHQVFAKLYQV